MDDKQYSLREVAVLTGYKVRTVRQWVHDGKIKAEKGAKEWRVPESEVRRLTDGDKD